MLSKLRRTGLGIVALGVLVAVPAASAPAVAGTESDSSPTPPVTVVATGLDNPRGLTFAGDTLLVAEAGRGGDGPCVPSPEGGDSCFGTSGAVTAVWPGHQRRVVSGLPSLAAPDGTNAIGPHDLAWTDTGLLGTIGLGANPSIRPQFGAPGAALGHVVAFDSYDTPHAVADLAGYEAANNPDSDQPGSAIDSNPYGIAAAPEGAVATDAGGNDLLAIDRDGNVSTLATFPVRMVTGPDGSDIPMQAVPTSVTRGPDGAWYVGQLTGFPYPAGGARVWRIVPGQAPTVYATGFTNIIDLTFDQQGNLYVLEIAKNGLSSGDPAGALYKVSSHGVRTEIAPGRLTSPGGVVVGPQPVGPQPVGPHHTLYVTNNSTSPGEGQVLRIG